MGVLETCLATLISLVRRQGTEHIRTASLQRLTSPRESRPTRDRENGAMVARSGHFRENRRFDSFSHNYARLV